MDRDVGNTSESSEQAFGSSGPYPRAPSVKHGSSLGDASVSLEIDADADAVWGSGSRRPEVEWGAQQGAKGQILDQDLGMNSLSQ